jgi:hypothetical protein
MTLGEVVDNDVIDCMHDVEALQGKVDQAQGLMNDYIRLKRSFQMTEAELMDMGIDTAEIQSSITALDQQIKEAATQYMAASTETSKQIMQTLQAAKAKIIQSARTEDLESPVILKTQNIKTLPLSSESIKLDSQYFSYEGGAQDDPISAISKFVGDSTSGALGEQAKKLAQDSASQVAAQRQAHDLTGTLIITASCTHRNVMLLDPFEIDSDRAISIWNRKFQDDAIDLDDYDPKKTISYDDKNMLTVVSGVKFGSCFVGMAHFVKSDIDAIDVSDSETAKLQGRLNVGAWLQNSSGGIGVDEEIMESVKQLLSMQKIYVHLNIIVMGATPGISSNLVTQGIKQLRTTPALLKTELRKKERPESTSKTPATQAEEALSEARLIGTHAAMATTLMRSLETVDHKQNKIFDITSLMTALENYLKYIQDGTEKSVGVPIGYFKRTIDKRLIVKTWLAEHAESEAEAKP